VTEAPEPAPRPAPRTRIGHLEQLVPNLPDVAPRLVLATLPTPVEPVPKLAGELGLATLLVKRDDATSPVWGGTKVRGLEFFLGRAVADGRTSVLTLGSEGSNHVVATSVFAREVGVLSRLVLFPHPDRDYARMNVERLVSLGADVHQTWWPGVPFALARRRLGTKGGTRPLWIAPGGSSGLGVLGAAEGALEVVEQVRAGVIPMPEDVVVAAGSCGTSAGLALGFALAGVQVRIHAVRVVPKLVASHGRIRRLADSGLGILRDAGFSSGVRLGSVSVVHSEVGGGYGRPTCSGQRAVTRTRAEGLDAETTYTGKAWAYLLSGGFRGRRVLFWNTFGGRSVEGLSKR
jgi:D-cysteine desulfhydrase